MTLNKHITLIIASMIAQTAYCPMVVADQLVGDPHDRPNSLLTQKQLWGIACPALLDELNHCNHDQLATQEPTIRNIQMQKQSLRQWWLCNNREDLLRSLKWLEAGGHREHFDRLARALEEKDDAELRNLQRARGLSDAEFKQSCEVCSKNAKKLGAKSLLGWDYCRYIDLCRWGYLSGYLNESEAWEHIMPAAKKLQSAFDSWADLGNNYMIGREFWSPSLAGADKEKMQAAYTYLLKNSNSPWVKLPWKLPLK